MGGAQFTSRARTASGRTLGLEELRLSKTGVARYDLSDPYHTALTVPWAWFLAGVAGLYGLINIVFALAYYAQPGSIVNAHPGSLLDPFFFSIETFATVGYGEMYPANAYSHWVAGVEIVVGMTFTAIVTGLIFVRFSKPRARILYAERPVITRHDGKPTLMLRFANGRMYVLTDTTARLSLLRRYDSAEGATFRRAVDLQLATSRFALFALTLTILHVIDETSPLFGLTEEEIAAGDMRLFLTIEAHDPALGATVRDLQSYEAAQIAFGMRYADAVSRSEDGRNRADLTRISLLEPEP